MAEAVEVKKEEALTDRETLYQDYVKTAAPAEVKEKPEESAAPEKAEVKEEPKQEEKQEVKPEPKKEEKFVPYAALKEEREKRKQLQEERDRLARVKAELEARQQVEQAPITDYESELVALKRDVMMMKANELQREEWARQEAIRQAQERTQTMIRNVDEELSKEGFKGFKHLVGAVTQELAEWKSRDEEEALAHDNPAGWKKIYKEKIYPEMKGLLIESAKESTFEQKKQAKTQANLVSSPGKQSPKEKSPEEMSEDELRKEYLRLRGME